ncbi:MAG: TRAP transporter large permease subunit [Rubrimonas sp.]
MTLPLDLMMFGGLIVFILLGYPVAFTIAGVAALFALLGAALGQFNISLLGALGQRVFGVITNDVLTAIPLFVLMGVVLERSRIAEELLETMGRLFGRMRGGLGVSVVVVGALLAASTGIVGATVVAMGMIALPTMLRNGYDARMACGAVCAAGTLGQIIPPSTLLIILADVMSSAFQQSQYARGLFTIQTLSVGQVFAAALAPGFLLVLVYIVYVLARAWLDPKSAPAMREAAETPGWAEICGAILPPVLLIVAVLGAVLGGIASPTEAAAVGAIGAILMAGRRMGAPGWLIVAGALALLAVGVAAGIAPVRLQRSDVGPADWARAGLYLVLILVGLAALAAALWSTLRTDVMGQALTATLTLTAMIFATIITASVFSLVFVGLGGEARVAEILKSMPGGATGALMFSMLLIFALGFFLDFVEITVILLPLVVPALLTMGHDPVWLAMLIALTLQTSFLTPPFGFSLFYLRGAAPPEITTGQIYAGVAPFIALQLLAVGILWLAPPVATWLPAALF